MGRSCHGCPTLHVLLALLGARALCFGPAQTAALCDCGVCGEGGLSAGAACRVASTGVCCLGLRHEAGRLVLRLRGAGRAYRRRREVNLRNRREMLKAAALGDVDRLRVCLARPKMSPDMSDKDRWTAAHWAAFNDHPAIIVELKSQGANISAVDVFGASPLHFAASRGNKAVLRALCDAGANLHIRDKTKRTAIGVAVRFRQEWASEYLKRVLVAKWRRLHPLAQSKWKLRLQKDRITGEELTRLLDSIKPIKTRGAVTLALGQPLWRGARKMLM